MPKTNPLPEVLRIQTPVLEQLYHLMTTMVDGERDKGGATANGKEDRNLHGDGEMEAGVWPAFDSVPFKSELSGYQLKCLWFEVEWNETRPSGESRKRTHTHRTHTRTHTHTP